jgi:transposase
MKMNNYSTHTIQKVVDMLQTMSVKDVANKTKIKQQTIYTWCRKLGIKPKAKMGRPSKMVSIKVDKVQSK